MRISLKSKCVAFDPASDGDIPGPPAPLLHGGAAAVPYTWLLSASGLSFKVYCFQANGPLSSAATTAAATVAMLGRAVLPAAASVNASEPHFAGEPLYLIDDITPIWILLQVSPVGDSCRRHITSFMGRHDLCHAGVEQLPFFQTPSRRYARVIT